MVGFNEDPGDDAWVGIVERLDGADHIFGGEFGGGPVGDLNNRAATLTIIGYGHWSEGARAGYFLFR